MKSTGIQSPLQGLHLTGRQCLCSHKDSKLRFPALLLIGVAPQTQGFDMLEKKRLL